MNNAVQDIRTQLKDLCAERDVGIVTKLVGQKVDDEKWEHFEWQVTLLYQKRSYKTTFRCGMGHVYQMTPPETSTQPRGRVGTPKPPDAADVLSCLCLDATSADRNTFEDWCSDLGYDSDSRKAEKIYNLCVETNAKLRRFLGEDFDLFASAEH